MARLIATGELDQAKRVLDRARASYSASSRYNAMMALWCTANKDHDDAVRFGERAHRAEPGNLNIGMNYALALIDSGDPAPAADLMLGFARDHPDDERCLRNTIYALHKADRYTEALSFGQAALERLPGSERLRQYHAYTLTMLGRTEEALDAWERAAGLGSEPAMIGCAMQTNYSERRSGEASLRAHERYGRALADRLGEPRRSWSVDPDPEKRLRVGVMSGDLRRHAVASFIEPFLEGYDRERLEVVCFMTQEPEDEVSDRLRGLVDGWRRIPAMLSAQEGAALIERERIDVLLELSGHTRGARLDVVHLKPAPVIATWIGYPNTTGVASVDARFVDSITDPPGAERYAVERLVRIDPCFLCYRVQDEVSDPGPAPVRDAGRITFGSFNNYAKTTDTTVRLWASVLGAVEGSRLLIKNQSMGSSRVQDLARARFVAAGVDPGRVEFVPRTASFDEHLATYRLVDIALDTFPYNGTTTTCEALSMCVPVVTMAGGVHASRVGASLLHQVGLDELVAEDEAGFVNAAAALAGDPDKLDALRSLDSGGLRGRMRGSALCDARAMCGRVERALRGLWREHCERTVGA